MTFSGGTMAFCKMAAGKNLKYDRMMQKLLFESQFNIFNVFHSLKMSRVYQIVSELNFILFFIVT